MTVFLHRDDVLVAAAAALTQSLARNPSLVEGNKRTAWAAAWTFLTINGTELPSTLPSAFDVDAAELLGFAVQFNQ